MLYLAHVNYEISKYMQDGYESFEEYRLVDAEDEIQAEMKVEQHYRDKTSEYSIYYQAIEVVITSIVT